MLLLRISFSHSANDPAEGFIYNRLARGDALSGLYSISTQSAVFYRAKHDPGQLACSKTANEFQQLLASVPSNQAVVIDVYADWCVACQPIEHQVLKSAQVQQALAPYFLIKLDLSNYDATHQVLLNQWDILGPPTYLFLDAKQQEIRGLRLTGAFSEAELLKQLDLFQQHIGQ